MKRLFMTTVLAALLAAGTVLAAEQNSADEAKSPDSARQKTQQGSIEFVAAQKDSDWLATSLLGRAVENAEGETLGDINNVVLDQNGEVVAVLIGVGGFLGLGGKDVAVTYKALEFKKREIRQPATGQDARESAYQRSANPPSQGSGSQSPMLDRQNQQTAEPTPRKDANQSDMVIVLNATAEQLESAPAFRFLGQDKALEQGESEPAEKAAKMKQKRTDQ